MENQLATVPHRDIQSASAPIQELGIIERAVVQGDLSRLSSADRTAYYSQVCKSLGLNPLTKPFDYIVLNNKMRLYALKDCTEQLRAIHGVSLRITSRECMDGVFIVTAQATTKTGKTDESIGAVPIEGLKGEARANAYMKAETKAKRRVTLSVCGLGMLDESETDSIPGAHLVPDNAAIEALENERAANAAANHQHHGELPPAQFEPVAEFERIEGTIGEVAPRTVQVRGKDKAVYDVTILLADTTRRKASTFSETLGKTAINFCDEGKSVIAAVKPAKKPGFWELTNLEDADAVNAQEPERSPEGQATDAEFSAEYDRHAKR